MKITRPTIILFLIILLFIFFLYKKCSTDEYSRDSHKSTTKICDSVFLERYTIFGAGATGTDLVAEWITDLKSFRLFVGKTDEVDRNFSYQCDGDTIRIKTKPNKYFKDTPKSYKITDLKKMNNLDD